MLSKVEHKKKFYNIRAMLLMALSEGLAAVILLPCSLTISISSLQNQADRHMGYIKRFFDGN